MRDRSVKPTERADLKGRPGEDLERIARPAGTPPNFSIRLTITPGTYAKAFEKRLVLDRSMLSLTNRMMKVLLLLF